MDKRLTLICVCIFLFPTTSTLKGDMNDQLMCISRLEFEQTLLQKIGNLEHAVNLLQQKVDKEIADIQDKTDNIKEGLADVEEKIDHALARIDIHKIDLTDSVSEFIDEKDAIWKKKIGNIKRTLNKALAKEKPVVFSVIDPRSKLVDGVPVFQTELINEGGAYDLTTGKFTGPVDGIYSFTFTLRSSSKGYAWCRIRQNEFEKNYAISEGDNKMATVTVYLKLKSGDIVDLGQCANWEYNAGTPTSFSGYLMYRL